MISLLVVNYRTATLAAAAIRSARASSSSQLHVVAVDNSCDADEAALLRDVADELVVSPANRGYGGAINDAWPYCRGEVVIVSNPDVVFFGSAIDDLAAAVAAGNAVAGPALFWDAACSWLLPPSELHTGLEQLDRAAGSRSARWRSLRDTRRITRRAAFWRLSSTTPVRAISGAVMAIDPAAFVDAGGFDERFHLYFEETDFLRRVGAHRTIAYVPAARCRHVFNQSAARDAERAARVYAESERKYLEKWNGPFVASVLKRFERPLDTAHPESIEVDDTVRLEREGLLIEASPLASFDTAAGHFAGAGAVTIPADVLASHGDRTLYLRAVDPVNGRVLQRFVRYGT